MLIRIVRMTFDPQHVGTFLDLFADAAPTIRAMPACRHLELWQDARFPNIMTTYSHWTDDDALDAYRNSDFFNVTWKKTKKLFAAPPEAWSHRRITPEA